MVTREASGAILPEGALSAALDALPFGAVLLDEAERVMYANRRAERMVRGMRIGGAAEWAAIPRQNSGGDRSVREGSRGTARGPEVWIRTLSGGLGGRVRAMRIAVEGLDRATLI